MKKLIILTLILLTTQTFAQKANVTILDPDIESKELRKDFNVHRGSTHVSSLPPRDVRENAFRGVSSVQKYDELKKDILFMDLKSKSVGEIQKKYPELSITDIKTLRSRR